MAIQLSGRFVTEIAPVAYTSRFPRSFDIKKELLLGA